MNFTVENSLFELIKNNNSNKLSLKFAVLILKGVSLKQNSKELSFQFLYNIAKEKNKELVERSKKKYENGFEIFPNRSFWDIKNLNAEDKVFQASHITLQERLFNNTFQLDQISNINTVINILNAFSIKDNHPIGAHDLNKIVGDITLGQNNNNLGFTPLGKDTEVTIPKEEYIYADDEKVLTRGWVTKQSELNKITETSTNIFIPMDIISEVSKDNKNELQEKVQQILNTLSHFVDFDKAQFAYVNQENSSVDLDNALELALTSKTPFENILRQLKPISKDKNIIKRILDKATEDILPTKKQLETLLLSGLRLKIYQGFDPTADTLHIGHTVMMRKLEDFRKLGHEVIFLMGNFTAQIGDPSDKKSTRQPLTLEQTNTNLKKYKEQASAIVDINNQDNPVTVLYNFDWLNDLTFENVIDLASEFTVQQMMKRSMFAERLKNDWIT